MSSCPMCQRWEHDSDLQILEMKHSYVVLNRDQFFPGYTLLFTKIHATELFQLEQTVRTELMEEVSRLAQALHRVFAPDKINYELLGNMVPHIHWHIVPRFVSEALWPRPIWAGQHDELLLAPDEYQQRINAIRSALA